MAMSIVIEKQSIKFIKPIVETPPTLSQYKLGFIDEFAPAVNVGIVLFFSASTDHNPIFLAGLEKSLEKTLTRFYPLAGRYVEKTATIDCNDHGAEFINAKVNNIKLEDFLVSKVNDKFIDEFIPSKITVAFQESDPLLAIQVTTFECGGVAIGVSATHKLVDASTLCTFITEWAITNREVNGIESFSCIGFNSSLLFPPRGLPSFPVQPMNENKYTRIRLSFSGSEISNMKLGKGSSSTRRYSKVQLVSSIIWKAFIGLDLATNNFQRESILVQGVNLRGKMASLVPKTSCGNLCGLCATECKTLETSEELIDLLSNSVKKSVTNFVNGQHDSEEGQAVVFNSLSFFSNIRESTNLVAISSWCNFPFYELDFGFGKPIWAAPGTIAMDHSTILMDDAEGNGVEAYVVLQVKDVPYFEEALKTSLVSLLKK